MADYCVSNDGSDATGDGSALNPWRTANHAVGAGKAVGATLAEPTTLWFRGGDLFRENIRIEVVPSAAAPLTLRGDSDGAAFASGGVANPRTGAATISGWAGPAAVTSLPAIDLNGASHVAVERLKVIGGNQIHSAAQAVNAVGSTHMAIRDCVIVGAPQTGVAIRLSTAGESINAVIQRCVIVGSYSASQTLLEINADETAATYDAAVRVEACQFFCCYHGLRVVRVGGAGGAFASGIEVAHCGFFGLSQIAISVGGSAPTGLSAPVVALADSVFQACGTGVWVGHQSQIVEDGNRYNATTPRTNTTAGPGSVVGFEPSMDFLDAVVTGGRLRPLGEPTPGSGLLGAAVGSTPETDLFGRDFAGPASIGALERAADPPGPPCPDPGPGAITYIFQVEG